MQDVATAFAPRAAVLSPALEQAGVGADFVRESSVSVETGTARDLAEKVLAATMLLLLAPVFVLIALAVRWSSPGPIFFSQRRVGRDGEYFPIFKFRTMVLNAEDATGPVLSWQGDPRVTRIGKFLRLSHLDELPQLINILRGEMAFIGPRPERPEFTEMYCREIPAYAWREMVRPGVTGLAQVMAPYDAPAAEKLVFDLEYVRHRHLYLDIKILGLTLLSLLGMRRHWREV